MTDFDRAWKDARDLARHHSTPDRPVVVIRDVTGRIAFAFSRGAMGSSGEMLEVELGRRIGRYASNSPSHDLDDRYVNAATLLADDRFEDFETARTGTSFIDRSVVGNDWHATPPLPGTVPRLGFYGFKGGVGRSTAAARSAIRIANSGSRVLVLDLDLESPGIGDMLLGDARPEYGIVDHMVASAIDPSDETPFTLLSQYGSGNLFVAPAEGERVDGYTYLPKLNRIYTTIPDPTAGGAFLRFGDRLERALNAALKQQPGIDVVILDSRAGLHDIAVVALTRLATHRLFFCQNSLQTRSGIRELLTAWRDTIGGANWAAFDYLRRTTTTIAALSPRSETYLNQFADDFQEIYAMTLYDDDAVIAGGLGATEATTDVFTFSPLDQAAPHFPVPLFHARGLVAAESLRIADFLMGPQLSDIYADLDKAIDQILSED